MSQITQRGATSPLPLTANGTFQTATDASLATLVGTRWDLADGGQLILVSTSSATTTVAGDLYQDAALVANHQTLTVTAFNAYGTSAGVANTNSSPATVTVTLGATAMTLNQYQGGFLIVTSGTGIGQTLKIQENPVATQSATGVVITLEDSPNVALDTTSVVSLTPPHGANVIISPTTYTNGPAGVALYAIAPSSYGFLKCKGVCAALSDSTTPAVGHQIMPSTTTAGAIASGAATGAMLGWTIIAATSANAKPVFLDF